MDNLEIKITSDGSHTLFLPKYDESYHSKHGAIAEAVHVFIEAGLMIQENEEISILEIGFGTGLNCLLSYLKNEQLEKNIKYTGVEAFPVEMGLVRQLNFTELLSLNEHQIGCFEKMHSSAWGEWIDIGNKFKLKKKQSKFEALGSNETYSLIYYDAFGPRIQPELWSEEMMVLMYDSLKPGGIFVTYCAKGSVKRGLKAAGFEVEALPGPPGKREMTRAIKR